MRLSNRGSCRETRNAVRRLKSQFFFFISVIPAVVWGDDPSSLLADCRNAFGGRHSAECQLTRIHGEWELTKLQLWYAQPFKITSLKQFDQIRVLLFRSGGDYDKGRTPLDAAILSSLPNLRELTVDAADLTDGLEGDHGSFDSVELLRVVGYHAELNLAMRELSAFPNLRSLAVSLNPYWAYVSEEPTPLGADWPAQVSALQKLSSLTIDTHLHSPVTEIRALAGLHELRSLTLGMIDISAEFTDALNSLPALESLKCDLPFEPPNFSKLQRLKAFNIPVESFLDYYDLKKPLVLPSSLRQAGITFELVPSFVDGSNPPKNALPDLEAVTVSCYSGRSLDHPKEQIADLSWLKTLCGLRSLTLHQPGVLELKQIVDLVNLRALEVSSLPASMTDEAILELRQLTVLEELKIKDFELSPRCLAVLENMPNLIRLSLDFPLSADTMEPILNLKNLRAIEICVSTHSDDNGDGIIQKLSGLQDLEEVNVVGRIGDESLRALSTLPRLRKVDLRRTIGYTDDGLARLMTSSSSLQEIEFEIEEER